MPELPEVQTVIDVLKINVINKKIIKISVLLPKLLKNSSPYEFVRFLNNQEFINITRLGKNIIFHLTNNKKLIVHLRMEGKFMLISEKEIKQSKHHYIHFYLNDRKVLVYHDTRQFGTFKIFVNDDFLKMDEFKKIALDPLDEKIDWLYLKNKFEKISKPIKISLLDQTLISGIGNIYADEILFDAKISPYKKTNSLSKKEIKQILSSSKKILTKAIKYKGTTLFTFKFDKFHTGEYQKFLKIHSRKNKNCLVCKQKIFIDKINGRSTFYCRGCQKC